MKEKTRIAIIIVLLILSLVALKLLLYGFHLLDINLAKIKSFETPDYLSLYDVKNLKGTFKLADDFVSAEKALATAKLLIVWSIFFLSLFVTFLIKQIQLLRIQLKEKTVVRVKL